LSPIPSAVHELQHCISFAAERRDRVGGKANLLGGSLPQTSGKNRSGSTETGTADPLLRVCKDAAVSIA